MVQIKYLKVLNFYNKSLNIIRYYLNWNQRSWTIFIGHNKKALDQNLKNLIKYQKQYLWLKTFEAVKDFRDEQDKEKLLRHKKPSH